MTVGTNPSKTAEPFAEIFRVDTSSTDNVYVWDIPKGTIIELVMAKIYVAGTGSGNIIVGDASDADGYILAHDATSATDHIAGETPEERGAYLYMGVSYHSEKVKFYASSGSQLIMDCSGTLTTEATVDIFVFGKRYAED
jgi:hypothetical protein